ncbi:MAG: HAD hydrolase family protein [Acholeplasmatales bacterium]|nr:HAD hydrolase family protein [Acholeplasmatales bacterium]
MFSILSDFEGTLITDNGSIKESDLFTLRDLIREGNHICIVSSASFDRLKEFKIKYSINIDILSIISGVAEVNGKIYQNKIPAYVLERIYDEFHKFIYTAWASDDENTYIYNFQERLDPLYPKANRVICDKFGIEVPAAIIAIAKEKADQFHDFVNDIGILVMPLGGDTNRSLFRIYRGSSSKADAYYLMKNAYNDTKTIGATDSIVDLDMLKKCDIKIAMKNGDPEIKDAADYVTEYDNNEGGLIKLLDNICHL